VVAADDSGSGDVVKMEQERLARTAARWRGLLPPTPAHPPIPVGSDQTTATAAAAMAHWPVTHAALAAHREAAADAQTVATGGTVADLTGADQDNAAGFDGRRVVL